MHLQQCVLSQFISSISVKITLQMHSSTEQHIIYDSIYGSHLRCIT